MFSQAQPIQRAMNPHTRVTRGSADLPVTAATLRVDLNVCFIGFNTQQRANAVLVLWGADETEETRGFGEQVKQLISVLAGDDPHHSARFALALDLTLDHIDDIGLEEEKRHQLYKALNTVGGDYESTATEVRAIVGESLKASESLAAQEAVGSAHVTGISEPPFTTAVPLPVSMEPLLTDSQPKKATETPKKQSVTRSGSETKRIKPRHEPLVSLDTESSFVESEGTVGIRQPMKSRLSTMTVSVRNAFSAAREELSAGGKKLKSTVGEAAESIKHNVSASASKGADVAREAMTSVRTALSPTITEVRIPAVDELRNAFNGKALARLRSSTGRIAETAVETARASATKIAKGLSKAADAIRKAAKTSGRKIATATRVVAHGVAHGAKAAAASVTKGAAWISNRWSGLRGFERV